MRTSEVPAPKVLGGRNGRKTWVTARWGEVIEAATTVAKAQCLQADEAVLDLPTAPAFGTFVRADGQERDYQIYGVVYEVITGSIDTTHRPAAMGMTRQELREHQPQIFDLLRTDVSFLVVAYRQGGRIYQYLPPHPPQIHDFVHHCAPEELVALTERLDFLRTLIKANGVPTDELVPACLRHAYEARREHSFLVAAGRELAGLLRDDYDRLTALLRRMRP